MERRELRVLLVTPDFPPETGGIQELLAQLVRHAHRLDVRVLTFDQRGAADFDRRSGMDIRRVGRAVNDRRLAGLALAARSLSEGIKSRPDVILSGHLVGSVGAIGLRRALRVPLVQYVHADEVRARPKLARAAVSAADMTIAVSEHSREIAVRAGAEPDRVRVVHPGVDLPAMGRRAVEEGPPTIITVASLLFRYKGHDVTLRALPLVRARVSGARWVVIGDGPCRPALESAISAYGLGDAVALLGRVDDVTRDRWLERGAVFCMPSRNPPGGLGGEGFGIAYLEAAARAMPSVAGNVGGARDAILDGTTGLLVDPTDHLAVAGALTELLADPNRAEAMGMAARRWAEEHAWPRVARRVEAVLEEAISMQGRV